MMHGQQNVKSALPVIPHKAKIIKISDKIIPVSAFRRNRNYLLPRYTPRPNIRQAFIRRYTFLSIPGTAETFLFIFPQGRGVAIGGGGKGCGRPWRQSLRGTKINILNKKKPFFYAYILYITQQNKEKFIH